VAAGAIAGAIISIAHQGVLLTDKHGTVPHGRIVHSQYRFREFIKLSREHGAHFLEELKSEADVGEHKKRRFAFQKTVLGYDQLSEQTHLNYSAKLLQILGWSRYEDMATDLMSLFQTG
jgi:hypothetical protein